MTELHSCRKICCFLVMFSYLLVGYAQDTKRKILKKVPAEYPQILKEKGIGGTVRLKVFIKPDGSVKDMEVLGGNPILAESAQKSVRQWKFSPLNSDSNEEVVVNFHPATEQGN